MTAVPKPRMAGPVWADEAVGKSATTAAIAISVKLGLGKESAS